MTNAPDPGPGPDRGLVREVLSATITPESDPWVFEEDALLYAVRRLEEDDPGWLLAQLADRSIPFERRRAQLRYRSSKRPLVISKGVRRATKI